MPRNDMREMATEPDFAAAHPQNGTFGLVTVYFLKRKVLKLVRQDVYEQDFVALCESRDNHSSVFLRAYDQNTYNPDS